MFDKLLRLKDGAPWSFIGAVVTVCAVLFAIYVAFFYERKPALTVELLGSARILSVSEQVEGLECFYRGSDITQANQSLRVMVVRIQNTGSADIPMMYYDLNDPLGLKITSGEIVEPPELLEAGSDYLERNVAISQDSPQLLTFAPVILDRGDYFVVKLLILHDDAVTPDLTPIGKVTGVREIEIRTLVAEARKALFQRVEVVMYAVVLSLLVAVFSLTFYSRRGFERMLATVIELSQKRQEELREETVRKLQQHLGEENDQPESDSRGGGSTTT